MIEKREMANQSRRPNPCCALTSFLVSRHSPPLGSDSLSPGKTTHGFYASRGGGRWPNQQQWATRGPVASVQPLQSTLSSGASRPWVPMFRDPLKKIRRHVWSVAPPVAGNGQVVLTGKRRKNEDKRMREIKMGKI